MDQTAPLRRHPCISHLPCQANAIIHGPRRPRKEHPMKAGISLMLGLLLAFVLVFAYWLRTAHPLAPHWPASVDRGLDQIDGLAELAASHR